jgi:2-methylisocitrate lyase-like PEP mutase family enzyme
MTSKCNATTRFRQIIARRKLILMPSVGDPLAARLVAREGFEAVMSSGNATSASRLGMPDVGLLTLSENAENAGRIAQASGLPVFADADTGYGGFLNVRRSIQEFERAGVAAVMIEDQQTPKRCGMLAGKKVVPTGEMVAKVKAALDARHDDDLVIVARTDARAVEGLDAAIQRAQAYQAAGADVIFVEGPRTLEEAELIGRSIDLPLLYNVTPTGSVPSLDAPTLERLGYRLLSCSVFALLAAIPAIQNFLRILKATGDVSLAKGGTGDVLTGVIASLIGQGMAPAEAACTGVWVHGRAGELAGKALTPRAVLASNVIQHLPEAFGEYSACFGMSS